MLHVTERSEWRGWLRKNYRTETDIWLVYSKKHTGKPRISYNDAVEEALCFGWIDSVLRTIDADRFAQRFSVRKSTSRYSQANKERLRALVRQGKVVKKVLETLPELSDDFHVPSDILEEIRGNAGAWKNFNKFSPAYARIRVAYIDSARKRPDEFEKRLAHFIKMSERNRQFGYGGIEKHY